ncbi:MAG: cation-translocating P-type ATPase [Bacteroidota bacterium]
MKKRDQTTKYTVTGVCCSTEESVLRKKLDAEVGVDGYRYNSITCELNLLRPVSRDTVVNAVRGVGFGVRDRTEAGSQEPFLRRHRRAIQTGIATVLGFAGATLLENGARVPGQWFIAAALLVGGWEIAVKGFKAIRHGVLDTNCLMMIAAIGAVAINKWEEAAAVVVLFSVSLMLESYASARTRRAVQSLMTLSPQEASVVRDGQEVTVKADSVRPGEIVSIRPGMRIPLDGVVVEGSSTVSEAMLTGEPAPVEKSAGSEVYAGCLNERGSLRITVTRVFEETRLAHIVHLVEEAQHQKAPTQITVDRFASRYTWAVLAIALAVAMVPPLFLGAPFATWFYRALILLVISCPCAFVISTPVTFVSALTAAARSGILVKGGRHFETLARTRTVAFDKTGTLTEGRLQLTDIVPLNGMRSDELLALVAAVEERSEHQLGSAIVRETAVRGIARTQRKIERFEALPGRGVKATTDGGELFLGNRTLAIEHGYDTPELVAAVERFEADGKTTLTIGRFGEAVGIIALKDVPRRQSRELVSGLRALDIRNIVLLSGDSSTSAGRLSEELGLDEGSGSLLPEDKVEAIKRLRARYGDVAMVGDGINDTPALSAASVGIAMGASGSDAALEAADVVLMGDDLLALPPLFVLSRKTVRIIKENITFALGVKALFVILSISGFATLWLALLADDGAALLVILNGMRVLRRLQWSP